MNPLSTSNRSPRRALAKAALAGVVAGIFSGALGAQALDVPNYPLQTGAGNVPPNILYILDDSGSMDNETMPNSFIPLVCLRNNATDTTCRGNRASQMAPPSNTIAYRPDVNYETWVNSDGTPFTGGQVFDAAFGDRIRNTEPIDLRDPTSCADDVAVCGGPQTFLVPKDTANTAVSYLRDTRNYWRYQIRVDSAGAAQIVRSELANSGTAGEAWGPAVDSRVITNDFAAINQNTTQEVTHQISDGWLRVETLASGVAPAFGRVRLEVYISNTDDLQTRGERLCDANVAANGLVQLCPELHGQVSGRYWFRVSAPNVAGNNVTNVRLRITTGGNGCTAPATGTWAWRGCTVATGATLPNPARSLAEELANYATYFSYHRTRMKVAKAGSSKAFSRLGDNVRIGFRTINNASPYNIPVNEADGGVFKGTARTTWFSRLFAAGGSSGTPLRTALHNAGQYFQDSSATGPYGPQSGSSQLACRQNFAILTTDGFWNQAWTDTIGNSDGTDGPSIPNPRDDTDEVRYTVSDPFRDGPTANYSATLGDIAMHYWKNDLRTDLPNLVPAASGNPAFWQHMSTYGVSIGLRGTLDQGTVAEIMRDGRPRRNGVAVNWPDPTDVENAERIDDLLHAAVNGRGEFIAATDASRFAEQLTGLLGQIQSRLAAGSNVAVNSSSFQSDTRSYQAVYQTVQWTGDLIARDVTPSGISNTEEWRVSERIEATYADASATNDYHRRTVLTFVDVTGGTSFPTAAQTAALARTTGVAPVSGANNAEYVRGNRALERSRPGGTLRNRVGLLGDIVNSSPFYLRENETIFVGANDGMLHAVNALTGDVRFSYVPKGIDFTKLASLSDPAYAHEFFVDGPVTVSGDQIIANRNILIGTLGRGGKGVYALDVTNPGAMGNADVLWDQTGSTDADMGYATGLPLIVKGNNGKNLAIVANGMNSTSGDAALFIYELETGVLIKKIAVGATGGNGLSSPRGADIDANRFVDYVYAGDLRGNVWKFDLTGSDVAAWGVAHSGAPLFVARDGAGNVQPITGGLALARDPATAALWVAVGTGRLIEESDMTSTTQQSVYALIDNGSGPISGRISLTARTISATAVDDEGRPVRAFENFSLLPGGSRGWYLDLGVPSPAADGERVVSGLRVRGRALFFSSVIPRGGDDCESGGSGYLNAIDIFAGTSPQGDVDADADGVPDSTSFFDLDGNGVGDATGAGGSPVGSVQLDIGMPTESSQIDNLALVCGSGGVCDSVDLVAPPGTSVQPRRLSWRELVEED